MWKSWLRTFYTLVVFLFFTFNAKESLKIFLSFCFSLGKYKFFFHIFRTCFEQVRKTKKKKKVQKSSRKEKTCLKKNKKVTNLRFVWEWNDKNDENENLIVEHFSRFFLSMNLNGGVTQLCNDCLSSFSCCLNSYLLFNEMNENFRSCKWTRKEKSKNTKIAMHTLIAEILLFSQ